MKATSSIRRFGLVWWRVELRGGGVGGDGGLGLELATSDGGGNPAVAPCGASGTRCRR